MKLRSIIILLILLISLAPAFYLNKVLQRAIQPRQSMVRLFVYILVAFSLVFVYSFLIVWLILHLFPVAMK